MEKQPVHALTRAYNNLSNVITSPVTLKNPFTLATLNSNGIWDTGATNSVITKSAAQSLGLAVVQKAVVNGVHGSKEVNVYLLNITLHNESISITSLVTECEELSADSNISLLIGMNVINMGDFCITNFSGKTVMSFRVPSIQKTDYVEQINLTKPIVKDKKIGPNELCPCGSGLKYKRCHGKR